MTRIGGPRRSAGGRGLETFLIVALALGLHSVALAQDGRDRPDEIAVTVEPIAGGAQFLHSFGSRVQLGAVLTLGPVYGVWFSDSDIRDWGAAYPVLAVRVSPAVRVLLSPIGGAISIGNDFGTVYPSAQGGLELTTGPVRVGSLVRVIRVAGGHGSGTYLARWIPVRASYAFRW
jgi:hypothetical protein